MLWVPEIVSRWSSAGVRLLDHVNVDDPNAGQAERERVSLLLIYMSVQYSGGDNHEEAYNQVYDDNNSGYDDNNQAKFSHEAVGGKLLQPT